jgi:uncharacterized membrane protein
MEIGYRTLKLLHVFGAVLFVGNILVTALWKTMADRTRDAAVVAFAQRMVTVTDFCFTSVGAALVLVPGVLMAQEFGPTFWTIPWLGWGLALFGTAGLIWTAVLIPIQVRQSRLARGFAAGGPIPEAYWRLGRWWAAFGALATLLPIINLYLMVHRPE